ncbi:hypothetical protein DFS34DRAFT_682683 [Phlyctochytrium arcticum]|nr:hypothetical protein DFS34DRAFT_682683 [Phlyctochytrium arcticum]
MASTATTADATADATNAEASTTSGPPTLDQTPPNAAAQPKTKRGRKGKKAPQLNLTREQATGIIYDNRVKAFKEYIAESWPEFVSCLETGGLDQNTPRACRPYLENEMENKNLSYSTAEQIQSALKDNFTQKHDCYESNYEFVNGEWQGNPINHKDFKTYFDSIKRLEKRTSMDSPPLFSFSRAGALCPHAPSPARASGPMAQVHIPLRRLGTKNATGLFHVGLVSLDPFGRAMQTAKKYVRPNIEDNGLEYHEIELPATAEEKDVDAFGYLSDWIAYLDQTLVGGLQQDDYLFPIVAGNKKDLSPFRRGTPLTTKFLSTYLKKCIDGSNLLGTVAMGSKFTTHCFRQGGSQHRFMYAKIRWSLRAVRWWGGWGNGEHIDTIVKYLLDEVGKNESYFGNMMRPGRAQESSRGDYFSAEDAKGDSAVAYELKMITRELRRARQMWKFFQQISLMPQLFQELKEIKRHLLSQPQHPSTQPPNGPPFIPATSSSNIPTTPIPRRASIDTSRSSPSIWGGRKCRRRKTTATILQASNTQQEIIPMITYWFESIKQWTSAGPNLPIPLKFWTQKERSRDADTYSNRKAIVIEVEFCGGMARFNDLRHGTADRRPRPDSWNDLPRLQNPSGQDSAAQNPRGPERTQNGKAADSIATGPRCRYSRLTPLIVVRFFCSHFFYTAYLHS